jgi:hypothetical protein
VYAPNIKNSLGVIQCASGSGVTVPSFAISPQMSAFIVYYPNGQGTNGPPIEQGSNTALYTGFLVQSAASNFVIRTTATLSYQVLVVGGGGVVMVSYHMVDGAGGGYCTIQYHTIDGEAILIREMLRCFCDNCSL